MLSKAKENAQQREDDKRNQRMNRSNKWDLFREERAKVIKGYVQVKKLQKIAFKINVHVIAR